MPGLIDTLSTLVKVDGVATAVVVGRDGFVINSAGANNDAEAIGAVISTGFGSSESMGKELAVGRIGQLMAEFERGVLVSAPIGDEAILAVVTAPGANLGHVRYQIRKLLPEFERGM